MTADKREVKGNEQDCICEKPKGKHRKHCDAFRLSEFLNKCASVECIEKDRN